MTAGHILGATAAGLPLLCGLLITLSYALRSLTRRFR